MMAVPFLDELGTEIEQYRLDSETSIQEIAFRTALSAIPFAGSALLELSNGLAQRRAQERLNTVFEQMKQCLDRLGEEKVDRAYFHSAEFQTLLYLLLERLHATHDTEKLRMFGNALANAGNVDFQSNPKEDYVRVLRDLSLRDLQVLDDENLKGWRPHLPHISFEYGPEILASLYRLQGMGLVIGKMMPREAQPGRTGNSRVDGINALSDVITQPPKMTFYLSEFGTRFLQYLSLEAPAQS